MPSKSIAKPEDLAVHVFNKFTDKLPSLKKEILIELFDCLFYTSLRSEEGQTIQVNITLLDPQDYKENSKQRKDRWRLYPFDNLLNFDIHVLTKLSKAADPWSSSLAVFYDKDDKLFIHGMIDQAVHSKSFINFETDNKPDQPGLFSAAITGVGCLTVTAVYELIATLKQDSLIKLYYNVFQFGPIQSLLYEVSQKFSNKIIKHFSIDYEDYAKQDKGETADYIHVTIKNTLSRLLNQIKNYQHGGAILITDSNENLNIKYKLKYDRLPRAICNSIINSIEYLFNKPDEDTDRESMLLSDYKKISKINLAKTQADNELKGAIRFVASQSCVDGLVLLNKELKVQGFGVVILKIDSPEYVYISSASDPSEKSLTPKEPSHFGTRHQSMFAYCFQNPGSLGFIVSQDGDVRAITRINEKLIMWENIKIQKSFRSVQKPGVK